MPLLTDAAASRPCSQAGGVACNAAGGGDCNADGRYRACSRQFPLGAFAPARVRLARFRVRQWLAPCPPVLFQSGFSPARTRIVPAYGPGLPSPGPRSPGVSAPRRIRTLQFEASCYLRLSPPLAYRRLRPERPAWHFDPGPGSSGSVATSSDLPPVSGSAELAPGLFGSTMQSCRCIVSSPQWLSSSAGGNRTRGGVGFSRHLRPRRLGGPGQRTQPPSALPPNLPVSPDCHASGWWPSQFLAPAFTLLPMPPPG